MLLLPLALASSPHAAQLQAFGSKPHWVLPDSPPAPPAAASDTQAVVYGYHAYWGDDPTQLDFNRLTHLAIFEVGIDSDGTLNSTDNWTDVAGAVVPLAHAAGVRVHLCVISFDDGVQAAVLPSASKRASVIAALKTLVDQYDADGVNVDIEGLDSDLREDMLDFLFELDEAVEDVYVATPAIDWSDAWDEEAMSQLSGGMFIMGYAYHWTGGGPGPNDPLYGGDPWSDYSLENTIADYLDAGADPAKIVLGLPLYGQEWPVSSPSTVPGNATDNGWAVFMEEATAIAEDEGREWDEVTRTPYVIRSGTQLWYDDTESLQERIAFSMQAGLQGVGFWALTYEGNDPEFWQMVEDETRKEVESGQDDTGVVEGGPVARAGLPIEAWPGDTVYLNGRGSTDPEGMPLLYAWAQVLGPEVELMDADQPEPYFVVPETGSYQFELTVESRNGVSEPDRVEVVAVDAPGMCGTPASPLWGLGFWLWVRSLRGRSAKRV